ncbi:hypothetical protein [uncultured Alteromonas sp.]|uniref:hypothetical protein n=1 Tax=uncultured Alteromonas sp. TaxID=179113 RepID=UPI0030D30867|tara:strand:+ start:1414 stop:1734 length:321 start_codon:yes stop_codon:yes gene_type:complete
MTTVDQFTSDNFIILLDEYYVKLESRIKFSPQKAPDLAKKLNKKINVPIIIEAKKEKILEKIAIKVDNFSKPPIFIIHQNRELSCCFLHHIQQRSNLVISNSLKGH